MHSCLNYIVGIFLISPFCYIGYNVQVYTYFDSFCFINSSYRGRLRAFLVMLSPFKQRLDKLFMVSAMMRDYVELL